MIKMYRDFLFLKYRSVMVFLVIRPNQQDSQFYLLLDAFSTYFRARQVTVTVVKKWNSIEKSGREGGGCEIKWQVKL